MAKINKIKKWVDGVLTTIYPLTIPQAVIDPTSGKSARVELDEKANHGYETEPKTLKDVDDNLAQLAGEVSLLDAVQGAKIKDIENVISTMNPNQSAQLSVSGVSPLSLPKNAANGGMSMKLEGLTADVGGVITNFEPTGRVRSVDKNGLNPTALYLTAQELRSNGTVKDEIRKGANGYELVKRVGVGSINTATEKNGDVTFDNATYWNGKRGADTTITGGEVVFNGGGSYIYLTTLTIGKWYKASVRVNRWTSGLALSFGSSPSGAGTIYREIQRVTGETTTVYFKAVTESIGVGSRSFVVDGAIDNFTCMELGWADDAIGTPSFLQLSDGTILYTLATPEIIPISYGGILNSAENGTVFHEPVIADAGVYSTNMPILLTDYPISTLEEIIKHENGVDTYLDVSTAVIAPDGLSFTHPDLASGDLVLFTYAFDKESTNGNITATFYDSNVVKIDTVTGKAYKITDVVTNGVLTRTLTEV